MACFALLGMPSYEPYIAVNSLILFNDFLPPPIMPLPQPGDEFSSILGVSSFLKGVLLILFIKSSSSSCFYSLGVSTKKFCHTLLVLKIRLDSKII